MGMANINQFRPKTKPSGKMALNIGAAMMIVTVAVT